MESLFFLEEQVQNGLLFRLGQNTEGGAFFHWETVAAPPKGDEGIAFRQGIAARKEVFSLPGIAPGILPLTGPVAFQGKIWLGWEARAGVSLFQLERDQVSLGQLIRGLTPLIYSYASCHQQGFSAGPPDWGRFFYDEAGFYTPDPFAGSFLPSPPSNPPPGWNACFPPEIYRGERYAPPCDLFFLGLILYYVITGTLPYRLVRGWPNKNILAGAIIPPAFHRPEINPGISELMVNLLAADPDRRPPAQRVAEVWEGIIKTEEYTVSKAEALSQIQASRREWRKQRGMRIIKMAQVSFPGRAWVRVAVLVVFSLMVFGWIGSRLAPSPGPAALEFARSFYEKAAVMYGPVMGSVDEEPAGLMKDFELARKERLKIVTEVLSRPLARVDSMRVVEAGPKITRIETGLTWWSWDGTKWMRNERVELLIMERKKRAWQVRERRGAK